MKLNRAQQELKKHSDSVKEQLEKDTLYEVSDEINKIIQRKSYLRNLCDTTPRENNLYKLEGPMENPAWSLPSLGYVGMDFFEPGGEEVYASIFLVQAAKEWLAKYDTEGRLDIWSKAFEATARAIVDYENEAFFRLVAAACTQNSVNMPFAPIAQPSPPAKYCSIELISRMAAVMKANGKVLKTLLVSPEDLKDLREYSDTQEEETLETVFREAGTMAITIDGHPCKVTVVETNALGTRGSFNINDRTSDWGPFIGSPSENKFNDYEITNGNVLDNNGSLVKPGETQIYGFSEDVTNYLKMPLAQAYTAYWDPTLYKRNKSGFFGWQKMGMLCLNSKCMCIGIIDRS